MPNSDLAVIREDIKLLHRSVADLMGVVVASSAPGSDEAVATVVRIGDRIIERYATRYPKPESLTMGKGK